MCKSEEISISAVAWAADDEEQDEEDENTVAMAEDDESSDVPFPRKLPLFVVKAAFDVVKAKTERRETPPSLVEMQRLLALDGLADAEIVVPLERSAVLGGAAAAAGMADDDTPTPGDKFYAKEERMLEALVNRFGTEEVAARFLRGQAAMMHSIERQGSEDEEATELFKPMTVKALREALADLAVEVENWDKAPEERIVIHFPENFSDGLEDGPQTAHECNTEESEGPAKKRMRTK